MINARLALGTLVLTGGLSGWLLVAGPWSVERPLERGARLLAAGQHRPAVRALVAAVAAAPRDPLAHYYLGLAYAGVGLQGASIARLRDAVRLAPNDARFHAALGDAYRNDGERLAALAELEAAQRLAPDDPRRDVALAGLLLDLGRPADAAARLRHAIRRTPDAPDLHLLLASVLARAGDVAGTEYEYGETRRLSDGGPLAEIARLQQHVHLSDERSAR